MPHKNDMPLSQPLGALFVSELTLLGRKGQCQRDDALKNAVPVWLLAFCLGGGVQQSWGFPLAGRAVPRYEGREIPIVAGPADGWPAPLDRERRDNGD